ncbi:MAG: endo-1,4-beta-xylanase, partial [Undibacterium sp.]|nr:endo-1,4-beta-xylanase [Opitutaceae bacterium]
NDYSNHDASLDAAHVAHFEGTARYLQSLGAPLGGLGLQAHISANPSPPANVVAVLDRYAALGLPVRITEFDVNTDDEELQADYTRDFLIALYSHPTVVGCQLWGFWENAHWIPKAASYRADWSEKPNARAYKALVLDQWRTRATGVTDGQGTWRARGFHGDYLATIEYNGQKFEQTFSLRAGVPAPIIRVPLTAPRLVNLSTRAAAGTGDATLIPGFVIDGAGPKRVLLRGVGRASRPSVLRAPSLAWSSLFAAATVASLPPIAAGTPAPRRRRRRSRVRRGSPARFPSRAAAGTVRSSFPSSPAPTLRPSRRSTVARASRSWKPTNSIKPAPRGCGISRRAHASGPARRWRFPDS